MKKAICFAAALGMMMLPCAVFAQAPAVPPSTAPAAVLPEPSVIPADQQPTKEQLTKLFELMRIKQQISSMTKMMPAMMRQQMQAHVKEMQKNHPELAAMTEEQQQASMKVESKFMEKVVDLYTSDEMIADMEGIYQKHLTRSDVDGIIAFYSSPAGQHMVDMAPVIMQEYVPLMMQRTQERIKPLMDEMSKEMEQIAKPAAPSTDKPATK
jgi:hypothetical protein